MEASSRRLLTSLFVLLIILSSFPLAFSFSATAKDAASMANKQQIEVPFDTSLEMAVFQPIDMRVVFDSPAWAQDEAVHGVRIAFDAGSGLTEVESQIYDLEFSDDSHISACSVVFLIPEEADGSEEYFVCYETSQTDAPNYEDHVSIEDATYFYEPISGQKIDIEYFKVIEEGSILYGLCQKGELIGSGMGNVIIKVKPGSPDFETGNIQQLSSYYMAYSIDPAGETGGTMWPKDVKKTILVDGNLMVRAKIEGTSEDGKARTDNIYSYYYTPSEQKSIDVNCYHEILQDISISGSMQKDGVYGTLTTFKTRSATIDTLNIGEMLPKIHVFTEDELIKEYDVPLDPDADPAEWLIGTSDDIDFGSHAWVCMDDPDSGMTHAVLAEKSEGYLDDTTDGIQLKVSTKQHVKLPGLEADTGDVYITRNAYEGGSQETTLPSGMIVNYNMRFATFTTGGHEAVDMLSQVYQPAAAVKPISRGNVTVEPEEEVEKYELTAFVRNAWSAPLGAVLAAATGKAIPYIYAELYSVDGIASSGSVGRLPMGELNLEFDNTSLIEKIQIGLGLFDWKNYTLKKKIRFPSVEDGTYLIRIYRENPVFGEEHKYIGFGIVEVNGEDTSITIKCDREGSAIYSIVDDEQKALEGVTFQLLSEGIVIQEMQSDKNGSVILTAPCYGRRSPYVMRAFYDGFLIQEEEFKFGTLQSLRPLSGDLSIDLFDVILEVEDTLGLAPAVDISPTATSTDMVMEKKLSAEEVKPGEYAFYDVYPASYQLKMGYKSFELQEKISVVADESFSYVFPAEFPVAVNVNNVLGMSIEEGKITLTREGQTRRGTINDEGNATIVVPPGEFEMKVYSDDEVVAKQMVSVKGDKLMTVISSVESGLHSMVTYLGIIIILAALAIVVWKRRLVSGMRLLAVGLLMIALVSPWWLLSGTGSGVETNTVTTLIPGNMVTFTQASKGIGGDIAALPEEATMILGVLSMVVILVMVIGSLSAIWMLLMERRFEKIRKVISIVAFIFTLLSVILFVVVMSMIAEAGVGTLSGSMNLDISIPGASTVSVPCSWGLSTGFYLAVVAALLLLGSLFEKKLKYVFI